MLRNLISTTTKFHEDQALIFFAFGGFGRYVLYLLHEEFKRLAIPENKVSFLAFDTEQPHRDRLDLDRESEYLIHLDQFDGDVYVQNKENDELKDAVSHVPLHLLSDIEAGCKGVPAVGFVAFHKYDDLVITKQALRLIDEVRAKNPGKKIKLIVISGMAGSVSNGMTVPFLYRIRHRLREKKIRVEVFLATSEGYLGLQNVQEESVERNCVASAMLWEYAIAGRNGLIYPGKNGVRDKRMFDGRIAHRVYVFSGGSAETSLKYQAIASTIATSISTLELTKVGSYLDGDRVNYSAHILEREWSGRNGHSHPTSLLTMNVAGLKGDCLPQIFHLHTVIRFLQDLLGPPSHENNEKIKGRAISSFLSNSLNEDDLLRLFDVEIPTLTRETINQASVSAEKIYEFLKNRIDDIRKATADHFDSKKKREDIQSFIGTTLNRFSVSADERLLSPGNYLRGGLFFYEKLGSLLNEKLQTVSESISRIEKELFEGDNQKTLDNLLNKLNNITRKKKGLKEVVVKLGDSPTISLVTQIIDILTKIQQRNADKYRLLLLQEIYSNLLRFTQEQQDLLRGMIFKYTKMISTVDRQIEKIKRIGRSTFTYNESHFSELIDHLMKKIYSRLDVIPTQEIIDQLGLSLLKEKTLAEKECLETLLEITRTELNQLIMVADDLFRNDEKVYDYVRTMLDQFFMTLKIDRDRFPTLETSQSSFVICTRSFFEKYRDDLFEGYAHLETDNPFNVIVTQHEEGFPFISMSYMHRINEDFKELRAHGKSTHGHIMTDLDQMLPLLDA